ncbi:MAG: hypothetical protein A3C02_04065 [Candidatus Andersenbacteria bacterium RIFCSPHIGHO2_02_FULL_45_11]|nr:MAG: hypothetical protein A3C02_04065 [Candidatus Andersenbacteria bacterium RIFCSPHIGHO2_02_FULL_45_11]
MFGEPSAFNPVLDNTSLHIYDAGTLTKTQLQEMERAAAGYVDVKLERSARTRSPTQNTTSRLRRSSA